MLLCSPPPLRQVKRERPPDHPTRLILKRQTFRSVRGPSYGLDAPPSGLPVGAMFCSQACTCVVRDAYTTQEPLALLGSHPGCRPRTRSAALDLMSRLRSVGELSKPSLQERIGWEEVRVPGPGAAERHVERQPPTHLVGGCEFLHWIKRSVRATDLDRGPSPACVPRFRPNHQTVPSPRSRFLFLCALPI
ncbi:hypothetical protein LX32DRAFT_66479 [Colletotrichum zoysiae]|uniref:Uncharacterized protein n=1 Tax=Colletotrichum zoysiae TaxID=1216348 RepID=A0AAD9HBF8_9PEZI|nr:hypothetical protein LX32DRAFT_66479 [Colletotrichum zoysiae]